MEVVHITNMEAKLFSKGNRIMKQIFIKRLFIFFTVLLGCYFILYFLSQGNISVPDASEYRSKLYTYTFYILPILMMCNFFYLFSCLVKNVKTIIISSLAVGLIGPLWLLYAIRMSKDSEAEMAFMLIVVVYSIVSTLAFVILALINLKRKTNNN